MALCHVCRRQARGFGKNPRLAGGIGPVTRYCSMEHMKMVDPKPDEIFAMIAASERGGEYLDSVKKTDLATLTNDEWMTFIEAVCTGFTEGLAIDNNEIPF